MAASTYAAAARRPSPPPRDEAVFWFELGQAHLRAGRPDDAIAAFDAALKLRPAFPEALHVGGALLRDRGAHEGALRFFDQAIRLRPSYRDAVLDKSNLLQALGRLDEALATLDAALALDPRDAGLLSNKGSFLHELGRFADAAAAFEAALEADASLPQAHLNYAGLMMRQFRHAEALPLLDRAIALRENYAAAHANRGLTLKLLGRFEEAADALDAALALAPGDPYALTNRGELRLLMGDFARGWVDYQARFATKEQQGFLPKSAVPLWSGQPLDGLKLLVVTDAGNGDIIHFARYVPMLVAAGAIVTVVCRPRLQRLLARVLKGTRVVDAIEAAEACDRLVLFSSLPHVFATTVETIPGATPYLEAEPQRAATWRRRLGPEGLRIGLCWRGSQDWRADPTRSIPLDAFAALAALPGARLVALNIDPDGIEAASLPLERFDDLDAGPDAFVDTAALMASLDLVVTIDTSLAHLAGALGRPTFLLLRKVPEWRWLTGRDDTPWYPGMRLFRQEQAGDWGAPLARLVAAARETLPAAG